MTCKRIKVKRIRDNMARMRRDFDAAHNLVCFVRERKKV